MSERVVNLDNSPRPSVTLVVAGESFTIRRVVTGVLQLWAAFVKETVVLQERWAAYQKTADATGKKTDAETEARLKEMEELSAAADDFYQRKLDTLLRVIELLLIKNGYAFDRKWWEENAGEADYKELIIAVLALETAGSKKNEGEGVS